MKILISVLHFFQPTKVTSFMPCFLVCCVCCGMRCWHSAGSPHNWGGVQARRAGELVRELVLTPQVLTPHSHQHNSDFLADTFIPELTMISLISSSSFIGVWGKKWPVLNRLKYLINSNDFPLQTYSWIIDLGFYSSNDNFEDVLMTFCKVYMIL